MQEFWKGVLFYQCARSTRENFRPPTSWKPMPTFILFMAIVNINTVSVQHPVCVIWKVDDIQRLKLKLEHGRQALHVMNNAYILACQKGDLSEPPPCIHPCIYIWQSLTKPPNFNPPIFLQWWFAAQPPNLIPTNISGYTVVLIA